MVEYIVKMEKPYNIGKALHYLNVPFVDIRRTKNTSSFVRENMKTVMDSAKIPEGLQQKILEIEGLKGTENTLADKMNKDDTPVTPPPAVKPAHNLERCGQFLGIRRCEKYVPKTNADRIRCMTDEELVELLMKTLGDCSYDSKCPAKQICEGTISCRNIIFKWLKAPAEGLEEGS